MFKPGQTTAYDWAIEGRGRAPSWMALFFYYAMVPFAIGGVVAMWRRRITVLPVVVPVVIASVAAATTFGLPRYRAPAEVGIVVAAAFGLITAFTWLRAAKGSGRRARLTTEASIRPTEAHATAAPTGRGELVALTTLGQPRGRQFVRGLALITTLAAVVRVMNVLWWRPTTSRPGFHGYVLGGDAVYYHFQANAIAQGEFFVDPLLWLNRGVSEASAAHAPLYSLYLSFWSRLGVDTVTGHRLASSLLGVVAVALIGLLAYRLAGSAAGLIAAAIAAVYPQLWINDGMLLSESIAVLAITCALHAMYSFWRQPTTRTVVLLGIACAVASLARTELLMLFLVAVVPLAFARESSTGARASGSR